MGGVRVSAEEHCHSYCGSIVAALCDSGSCHITGGVQLGSHEATEEESCAGPANLTPAPMFQWFRDSRTVPLQGEARLPRQGQATRAVITQCPSPVPGIL